MIEAQPIYTRGADSEIAKSLSTLAEVVPVKRGDPMPSDGVRYLFCVGKITQARLVEQGNSDIADTFWVNAVQVMRECDLLLNINPDARICVIGSESAFKWSFDGAYAAAKAALHRYVETKRLKYPDQQLVCVAPSCIAGTRMNKQRNEAGVMALAKRKLLHPKQRWLEPVEVALMIRHLLCYDRGYTTGVVIRMNGGEHCGGSW